MTKTTKILLVEDDVNLGFVTQDNLTDHGFEVTLCEDGEKGWESFNTGDFDLCILDIMLPKKDGFSLAEQIRQKDKEVPILFLSAKAMKEDKITGFKTGADDYITKPFSIEELILRIGVFLRRSQKQVELAQGHTIGSFSFDPANLLLHHVNSGTEKKLTQKEAEILQLFCESRDKVLKREEILQKVWGDDDYFLGRSMDVFISKLRKYLKADPAIEIINFHGVGFKLEVKAKD